MARAARGLSALALTVLASSAARDAGPVFKLANGIEVPLVGFGTAGLGGRGEEVVREALQAGFLHIDTAQASEWYDEEAVGRAVASVAGTIPRKDVFLTTKVHPRYFGYEQTLESFKRSLEKLQTDYVDLLLLHAPTCWEGLCEEDPSRGSWQDAWRALETLYDQGKVRAIGVSNFDVRLLEELSGVAKVPVQAVQNWQDPLHQDREVLEWCHKHGVLYTSYSTLGTQWQWRAGAGGGNPVMENPVIKELATRERVSPALLALAWVLEEGAAVIPRSSKAPHIRELARLFRGKAGINLTQADMQRLRALDGSWEGHGDEL